MSLNYIALSGCLAQDSEVRYTVSGKPILEFSLAVTDEHGPSPEDLHFIRVVQRRDYPPELPGRLKKGTPVIVEGQLINRKFESSNGQRKRQLEIILENVNILQQEISEERKV